uniref:Uncharacterized protein n=1 Tax=Arundo donax TaxID=35708 RepID=A0A0A9ELI6_ARUDO
MFKPSPSSELSRQRLQELTR